jgi:hypothetical protein
MDFLNELSPFEAIPCIDIEALKTVDPSLFFNDMCFYLKQPSSKKFIDFYQETRCMRYGHEGLLPSEYVHEYHKIKNEWQRKVATVSVGEDLVVIVLKHVQMFQHIYKRLEGLPISASGSLANEELVFDALRENVCKKFLGNEEESLWLEKKGLELDTEFETYNYYSHVDTNMEKMNNRWRTKKGVNRLLKNPEVAYRKLNKPDIAVEQINNAFLKWKRDVEKTKWLSKGMADAITKYEYWNDPSVEYYLFEYGSVPVGLIVYLLVNEKIGYQLVNKSIDHMVYEEEVDVPEEVRKRIGAYMHYVTMKDLQEREVVDTFAGGAMGTRKASLGIHKAIMNDSSFGVRIYE